ncbi:Acyl-coenzyme A thioesterase 9, mitochondrial [Leucoagaricus sp. SymC.cos]|nr:Acyl-coenzyme A thioesterase 9, mitochondrial [Leucoagaricus sp. SymC.cos]
MFVSQALRRITRLSPSQRVLSTTLPYHGVVPGSITKSIDEENEGLNSMDHLLRVVREHSNPAYHRIVPTRTPILWSEALLNAAPRQTREAPLNSHEEPLVPRSMGDSYSELVLPFGSSSELMEQYTNASGGIRTGKLMEHLDSLAGSISYKHILGPTVETLGRIQQRGFYIVTASVHRLDMLAPLNPSRDLRISGQVIYTGHSSMEVVVKMESIGKDLPEETVLIGRFSMVCRDANTHRAKAVNPLIISTPEEQALYSLGESMKNRRQELALRSLSRVPPSSSEAEELHSFSLRYGQEAPPQDGVERVWMGDTINEKTMLMFPQERNVHQKIFGGYLMRLAYELGFTSSSLFTRGPVRFLALDSISFARPVPIGSILRLTSQIIHTSSSPEYPALVHVGVNANVVDVATGSEETTNDFRFTWAQGHGKGSPIPRKIVPRTYQEAMLWLEGKRALDIGDKIRDRRSR